MAQDIATTKSPRIAPPSFDEFYEAKVERLRSSLYMTVGDRQLANDAIDDAMARALQRWKSLAHSENPAGWVYGAGLNLALARLERGRAARDEPVDHAETAAEVDLGDNQLEASIEALPIRQRAALVCVFFLGWSPEQTGTALDIPSEVVTTRVERALDYIRRRHRSGPTSIEDRITDHLGRGTEVHEAGESGIDSVRRVAKRRRIRNRAAATVCVLVAIAGAGALADYDRPDPSGLVAEPVPTVDAPRSSGQSFGPISDGEGGFVAMSPASSGRFSSSIDGIDWYGRSRLNVRAIDLRLSVERFLRSGGRYVAMVESSARASDSIKNVLPLIAVSDDLESWELLSIDVGPLPKVEGLVPEIDLLNAAAAGSNVLAVLRIEEAIDYRAHGIRKSDVCVQANDDNGLKLHLCDGTTIVVASVESRAAAGLDDVNRLFLSEDGGPFLEVETPPDFDPHGLFSFGERFGMFDAETSRVATSDHGRVWSLLSDLDTDSRLGIVMGSPSDSALVVTPDSGGWTSHLLRDGQIVEGSLPIDLSAASIWLKPQIASGPAGWALFVTTSRPWERTEESNLGWALQSGQWVVAQLPGSEDISVHSTDRTVSYLYGPTAPEVEKGPFGGVRIHEPGNDKLLVEVTDDQIRASRVADSRVGGAKASVVFSADGVNWDVIWRSAEDTWYAGIAVGDSEVLLSSSQLTTEPVRIALDG